MASFAITEIQAERAPPACVATNSKNMVFRVAMRENQRAQGTHSCLDLELTQVTFTHWPLARASCVTPFACKRPGKCGVMCLDTRKKEQKSYMDEYCSQPLFIGNQGSKYAKEFIKGSHLQIRWPLITYPRSNIMVVF